MLLLAMGVGVLIGRSGSPKQSAAPAQVISVGSTPAAGTSTVAGESSFTGDWPSGTTGYTVQLQTLPQSGSSVSAVEAAKTAASVKGAKRVGALKSEEFSSLAAGNYVIYSGIFYHKKAEAQKALPGLKKGFPGASVIAVSNGSSGSSSGGSSPGGSGGGSGAGSSLSHPAPLPAPENRKGKSYEEKSKNLPNVIETG